MSKKRVMISVIIGLIAAISMIYIGKNRVKQVPLYNHADFNTINSSQSWGEFREKLKISKQYSKIEYFKLIIDKNQEIHSLNLDVVDKVDGKYKIYHYQNCFSCERKEENQVYMNKSTLDTWSQYEDLVTAQEFFSKLDELKKEKFFGNHENEFILLKSSGRNEAIGLPGEYFVLNNKNIRKIDKTENTSYQGINLMVFEK